MTNKTFPIINDFLSVLAKIKTVHNIDIAEICLSFPEFEADFKEPFVDYLKNNFELVSKMDDLKNPEKSLIIKLGTQYGLGLSDVEKNFNGFVVAVGMSLHSHVYGEIVLIDFEQRQKMA